jgi:hypothetical protein
MRLSTMVPLLCGLAACAGDKGEVVDTGDTDTVTDTDTDTNPNCGNAVLERYPADGETDVYAWSGVDILLSQADATATVVVTDSAGTEVSGTVERYLDDTRIEFLPSEPYAAGETYTATLNWGCDPAPSSFTAGSEGTDPVADPSSLIDRTWVLDLKDGRFVAPDGIGPALQTMLEVKLLLGVTAADATTLQFRTGAEDGAGGQDLSASTTDFDAAADFSGNPFFTASQPVLGMVIEGDPIDVEQLDISGSFAADGSEIVGFRMSGIVDTRDLKEALEVEADGAVCDLFGASFNVECEACPSGDGDYCITLVVADLPMPEAGFGLAAVP